MNRMIRLLLSIFFIATCNILPAQKVLKVHKSNGEVISFVMQEVDSLTVADSSTTPSAEGYTDFEVRFIVPNVYAVPLLASACTIPGEFCCVRNNGDDFLFSGVHDSQILRRDAISGSSDFSLGCCGLIIGMPVFSYDLGASFVVCYDMACPNCYHSGTVGLLSLTLEGKVLCGSCNRCYDLNNGGCVVGGSEGRTLFRYRAVLNGQKLMVNNSGGTAPNADGQEHGIDAAELLEDGTKQNTY